MKNNNVKVYLDTIVHTECDVEVDEDYYQQNYYDRVESILDKTRRYYKLLPYNYNIQIFDEKEGTVITANSENEIKIESYKRKIKRY